MKKFFTKPTGKIYFILTMAVIFFSQINTTAQVVVQLRQPPPNQFKLEHMWKITLINPTPITYRIYLQGTATEFSEGQIVDITTSEFILPPGTKVINTHELMPLDISVTNNKYADVVQNNNAVPTGDYDICITVINAETNIQLGMQCVQAQSQNLSQVELLDPENNTHFLSGKTNESNFTDDSEIISGSFITFNWLPPSPIPPGVNVSYSLKITEILGNQSSYDAMLSNPAFYINRNIYSDLFLYPIGGRKFQNKRYAWQVKAYLNNILVSESETREFTFSDNSKSNSIIDETVFLNEVEEKSFSYFEKHLLLASIDDSQLGNFLYAQDEGENIIKPLAFSGDAKLNFDAGYKTLPFSDLPKNVFTAELNPSLVIYGLPFTANFLLSTMQNDERQSINSFSFNIDFDTFKETLKSQAEDEIPGWANLISIINTLGIGTTYPSYSDYTLRGVPVTGLNVEINPGIFYAAFTASKNLRAIENVSYKRNLYAGRIGIGKKDGTNFIFTGLYARDDENSITPATESSSLSPGAQNNLMPAPKANYVFGTETKISLFDDKLVIEGHGNASVLTRDTRDADLEIEAMPGWLKGLVTPKISTSFDYSYAGKISYNNSESQTRTSFGIKMIGPGYTSLGVPNLKNDQLSFDAKVEQKFFEKHLSISTFFKNSHDNLIEWKRSRTTITAFGVTMGLNFSDLPYLQISYSPYLQKNDDQVETRKIENKTTMISAATGYTFPIEQFNFTTNFSFVRNDAKTLNGISDFNTNSFSVTEAISFDMPVSVAVTWGSIKANSQLMNSLITSFDLNINAVLVEPLTHTFGFNAANESDLNKKNGFYFDNSISMWDFNLQTRIEKINYWNLVDDTFSYKELLFNIMLSYNW